MLWLTTHLYSPLAQLKIKTIIAKNLIINKVYKYLTNPQSSKKEEMSRLDHQIWRKLQKTLSLFYQV